MIPDHAELVWRWGVYLAWNAPWCACCRDMRERRTIRRSLWYLERWTDPRHGYMLDAEVPGLQLTLVAGHMADAFWRWFYGEPEPEPEIIAVDHL